MGLRFRKSINLGGGFRVNLSKSGVGYSWGVKGARVMRTAKGKTRVTAGIPGTGLSYSTEFGSEKHSSSDDTRIKEQKGVQEGGKMMHWGKFIVCLLFGWLGIHKFMEKKIGMGFLYMFTLGLFGIGWLVDVIRCFCLAFRHSKGLGKTAAVMFAVLAILGLASGGSNETPEDQTVQPVPTITAMPNATAEPIVTAVPTEEITAEPLETPTVKPTEKTTVAPTKKPTEKPTAEPTKKPSSGSNEEAETNSAYVGNRNSKIFHKASCGSVKKMKESNKVFSSRTDLLNRGYDPCDNCKP